MDRVVAQDPAFRDRVTAVAALTPDFREIKAIMAIKVVTITRTTMGINSSSSLVIRATQSI